MSTGPISVRTPRPRGAIPAPPARLASALRHVAGPGVPASFAVVPPRLSYWLNDVDGDCVTAEEAFAKAAASVMAGLPELFIPDSSVKAWAQSNGYLNGASLTDAMDSMAKIGLMGSDGKIYNDGPYSYVDYTNDSVLRSAISSGPVKLGVAANQLENAVGSSNGWLGSGFSIDRAMDHCVSLCGYGTTSQCFAALGVTMPPGANPDAASYLLFTWSTIGVIDRMSMIAISSEAWLRNPTTVGQSPVPTPTPTPTPAPDPTPAPSTVLYVGIDVANRRVILPPGYSARKGLYPSQVNVHFGPGAFVAIPAGWTAIAPVVGAETVP